MIGVFRAIRSFLTEQKGANGVEYALLAGLIAIAFVVGAGGLGISLNTFFSNTSNCVRTPGNITNCSTSFDGSGSGTGNGGNGNNNGNGKGKGSGKGNGKK